METVDWPVLENAPIKEAIIDLRVGGNERFTLDNLPKAVPGFPNGSEILDQTFDFSHKAGDFSTSQRSSFVGLRFDSEDGRRVIQFRRDGYTFSMLQPYSNWQEMRNLAKEHWHQYTHCLKPVKVTRIATRYINQLHLPAPIANFEEYLASPPTAPAGLPNRMSSFLNRTVLHDPESNLILILTQALKRATEQTTPVTLDVDVFRNVTLDADSDEVWEILDNCRDLKNRAFFKSITDKALEMFK